MVSWTGRNKRQLMLVFGFTTLYLVVEVIGGLVTGSLALLADAGHMLTDVGGLGLALFAIRFAETPGDAGPHVRILPGRDPLGRGECRRADRHLRIYLV